MISVLFARRDSIYKTLDCDVWDADRDALRWPGGNPIVAHPPCRAWGQLRHFANPLPGEKELALWAVDQVRKWGGVLEHPERSHLWPEKNLPKPGATDQYGGFTLIVDQYWWGHRARKRTRLYVCGCKINDCPDIPLVLGKAPGMCGTPGRRLDPVTGNRYTAPTNMVEITKREKEATPVDFAEWLLEVANRCHLQQQVAA